MKAMVAVPSVFGIPDEHKHVDNPCGHLRRGILSPSRESNGLFSDSDTVNGKVQRLQSS